MWASLSRARWKARVIGSSRSALIQIIGSSSGNRVRKAVRSSPSATIKAASSKERLREKAEKNGRLVADTKDSFTSMKDTDLAR